MGSERDRGLAMFRPVGHRSLAFVLLSLLGACALDGDVFRNGPRDAASPMDMEDAGGRPDASASAVDAASDHDAQAPGGPCGDGIADRGEGCDLGSASSGGGCTSACERMQGYVCAGEPNECWPAERHLAMADTFGCGLLPDGQIACWGHVGPAAPGLHGLYRALRGDGSRVCAVTHDGTGACFSSLTNGCSGEAQRFEGVSDLIATAGAALAIRTDASLALFDTAGGSPDPMPLPAALEGLPAIDLDLHSYERDSRPYFLACAVGTRGRLGCFDSHGALALDDPGPFAMVAVARERACAIRGDGRLACYARLCGEDDASCDFAPWQPQVFWRFRSISAAGDDFCAVRDDGEQHCFGADGAERDDARSYGRWLSAIETSGERTCQLARADAGLACYRNADRTPALVDEPHLPAPLALVSCPATGQLSGAQRCPLASLCGAVSPLPDEGVASLPDEECDGLAAAYGCGADCRWKDPYACPSDDCPLVTPTSDLHYELLHIVAADMLRVYGTRTDVGMAPAPIVLSSDDGHGWSETATTVDFPLLHDAVWPSSAVVYESGVFVGARGTELHRSLDGVSFQQTRTLPAEVRNVAAGGGRFAVLTRAGKVLASSDGLAWQSATVPEGLIGLTFVAGRFWAVLDPESGSPKSALIRSSDGVTWSAASPLAATSGPSVYFVHSLHDDGGAVMGTVVTSKCAACDAQDDCCACSRLGGVTRSSDGNEWKTTATTGRVPIVSKLVRGPERMLAIASADPSVLDAYGAAPGHLALEAHHPLDAPPYVFRYHDGARFEPLRPPTLAKPTGMIATAERYFIVAGGLILSTIAGDYWATEFGQ